MTPGGRPYDQPKLSDADRARAIGRAVAADLPGGRKRWERVCRTAARRLIQQRPKRSAELDARAVLVEARRIRFAEAQRIAAQYRQSGRSVPPEIQTIITNRGE